LGFAAPPGTGAVDAPPFRPGRFTGMARDAEIVRRTWRDFRPLRKEKSIVADSAVVVRCRRHSLRGPEAVRLGSSWRMPVIGLKWELKWEVAVVAVVAVMAAVRGE
jgi:hypothetical protein